MRCDDYSGVRVACDGSEMNQRKLVKHGEKEKKRKEGKRKKEEFAVKEPGAVLGRSQIHQTRRALVNGLRIQTLLLRFSNDPNGQRCEGFLVGKNRGSSI